jgi:DNA polymerase-4
VLLLPGAAAVSKEVRFADLGIARVGDLVGLTPAQARLAFGPSGDRLRRQAQGFDETPVRPPSLQPSLDEDETLAEPSNAQADLERVLFVLCERAGERLRRARTATCRLRVSLRHVDDVLAHDETGLPSPAAADLVLFLAGVRLLERARARRVAVCWIEVRCLDLVRGERQMGLFGPAARAEPLSEAMDRLRGRFGAQAVTWGRRRFGGPRPPRSRS